MILDTSAIIAILQEEPSWPQLLSALDNGDELRMATPTLVELQIVAASRNPIFLGRIEALIESYAIEIVPFGRTHAALARIAYLTYGKGFHARARLNLGDCFAYALAKAAGDPLLFIGDDFPHTNIVPALPA
ncbi:MAG: type II toxin-antitoxin system VapC family toxin [Thermomicrobiales bacterium]